MAGVASWRHRESDGNVLPNTACLLGTVLACFTHEVPLQRLSTESPRVLQVKQARRVIETFLVFTKREATHYQVRCPSGNPVSHEDEHEDGHLHHWAMSQSFHAYHCPGRRRDRAAQARQGLGAVTGPACMCHPARMSVPRSVMSMTRPR